VARLHERVVLNGAREQVRVRASPKLRHHRLRFHVNGRFAGVSPFIGMAARARGSAVALPDSSAIELDSWVQLALPHTGKTCRDAPAGLC
jgi:hypothetical protein